MGDNRRVVFIIFEEQKIKAVCSSSANEFRSINGVFPLEDCLRVVTSLFNGPPDETEVPAAASCCFDAMWKQMFRRNIPFPFSGLMVTVCFSES